MAKIIDVPNFGPVEFPDSMSDDDIVKAIKKTSLDYKKNPATERTAGEMAPEKGFGQKVDSLVGDVSLKNLGRQVGLTARHGIEGVAETLGIFSEPIRLGLNLIPGVNLPTAGEGGKAVADLIGLPEPQGMVEKVAAKGAKVMAGGGAMLKGAQMASKLPGLIGEVASSLAANPAQQMQSAAGAGMAGGYAEETGGGPAAQVLSSVGGGILAPTLIDAIKNFPQGAKAAVEYLAPGISKPTTIPQVDVVINNILQKNGLTVGDLTASVLNQMRADVAVALKMGGIDDAAMARLADYRITGATPTRARISLDPSDVTRQANAAKFGINSADPKLQTLGRIENQNNRTLIDRMNDLGANTTDDAIAAAKKVMSPLAGLDREAKRAIDDAYGVARATGGRSAALDPYAFTQKANNLLDDALLGGKLDADVRGVMNRIAKGEMPFTVDVAEQLKTRIGDLQRASSSASERKALGIIRQALDDTPLLEGQGQAAIDAFNRARTMNRQWMSVVDRVPALQAVRDGVEPDKFVQQFIIGSGKDASVMDVAKLKHIVKDSPEAMQAIRGQIMAHLKGKALGKAMDEVGNISPANLNKAIHSIGERKMRLFFDKAEIDQIKAISRVASYEQFQPRGSAVNNSNTAGATLAAVFDKFAQSPIIGKIPLAPQTIGNVSASITARQALNAPAATVIRQRQPVIAPYLLPMAAEMQALLAAQEAIRKQRALMGVTTGVGIGNGTAYGAGLLDE
jgi:hypothetical protein